VAASEEVKATCYRQDKPQAASADLQPITEFPPLPRCINDAPARPCGHRFAMGPRTHIAIKRLIVIY